MLLGWIYKLDMEAYIILSSADFRIRAIFCFAAEISVRNDASATASLRYAVALIFLFLSFL